MREGIQGHAKEKNAMDRVYYCFLLLLRMPKRVLCMPKMVVVFAAAIILRKLYISKRAAACAKI